jgi:hypothetical protein
MLHPSVPRASLALVGSSPLRSAMLLVSGGGTGAGESPHATQTQVPVVIRSSVGDALEIDLLKHAGPWQYAARGLERYDTARQLLPLPVHTHTLGRKDCCAPAPTYYHRFWCISGAFFNMRYARTVLCLERRYVRTVTCRVAGEASVLRRANPGKQHQEVGNMFESEYLKPVNAASVLRLRSTTHVSRKRQVSTACKLHC